MKKLDIEALRSVAARATDDVRADAIRTGTLLPIWRDGRVVHVDPNTLRELDQQDALSDVISELRQAGSDVVVVDG
jgi:hypothetical protein